jgi:hypothetical protein
MGNVVALLFLLSFVASFLLEVYGVYLSFNKKWYLGAVALLVPGFALVIGAAKFLFRKDLLA